MKTLLRKKWFRRFCQSLLVLCSLLVLAYVFIDWRGARMKRDLIAQMRADGRPTSIAEMLEPLPRDEDNFAMVPILAQARDEWWNDKFDGTGNSPDEARMKLREMTFRGPKKEFARQGKPDLGSWKQNLKLSGSDAECLEAYDHKFGGILAELRAGMGRPETVSPLMHRRAASSNTDSTRRSSGAISLGEVAQSLGFRAELALAAGRPEVAYESLLIGIRISELIASEKLLIAQLIRGVVIRHLRPTLARALQTGGWDKPRIASIRNHFATLEILDGYRQALDIENFDSFALVEEIRRHPESIPWQTPTNRMGWQQELRNRFLSSLPIGWYQGNAALRGRKWLQFREDLGQGEDLQSWYQACVRAEKRRAGTGGYEIWAYPLQEDLFGSVFQNACRTQTMIRQAMLACDLETYRLDHGNYPDRLEETGRPIIDTMTGEPFHYRLTDTGYLLYSIGSDGIDQGGNRSQQDDYYKRDWVW